MKLIVAALAACLCVHPIFEPVDQVVDQVTCEQWEAYNNTLAERVWRTAGAVIVVEDDKLGEANKPIPPGDVTRESAPGLWQQIEWQCAPEYGVGIGNPYTGEALVVQPQA